MKKAFTLIRLPNLVMIFLSQVLVQTCLLYPEAPWRHFFQEGFLLLAFSTFCIAAAGYIINDYYDVKIDVINRPERVVVGKDLPRRQAILSHSFLTGIGVLVAVVLSWRLGAIHAGAALLLWAYSAYFKRIFLVGNLIIGLLGATMLLVVAVLAGFDSFSVWAFAAFAALISLIREIIKDMEDVKGDASFDCRTIPIVVGLPRTKWLLYFLLLCFYLFTMSAIVNRLFENPWFSGYMVLLVLAPALLLGRWLYQAQRKKDYTRLSSLGKFIMLTGILSMLLLA